MKNSQLLLKCCFRSTETVGLLGTGAQDVHLDFHTAPELSNFQCWLMGFRVLWRNQLQQRSEEGNRKPMLGACYNMFTQHALNRSLLLCSPKTTTTTKNNKNKQTKNKNNKTTKTETLSSQLMTLLAFHGGLGSPQRPPADCKMALFRGT